MYSENSAFASSSTKISMKFRSQMANPVEAVPERDALLFGQVVEAAPVRLVLETAGRAGAGSEDLVVPGPDFRHLLFGDLAVAERRRPVRPALEHGQVADLVGDLADDLDTRSPGTDHRDPLAGQVERLVRPVEGME